MFKNYFKIAWRNLIRGKAHSFINIAGLSIGMAVAILIGLWIWDELSFDSYHDNHRQLAQVMKTSISNSSVKTNSNVPIPLADELTTKFRQDFKHIALASKQEEHIVAFEDKKINSDAMWVQHEFPGMFTLKMLKGEQSSLRDPSSLMISESLAKTLFGNADPLYKIIKLDNTIDMKIAGVYEDLPRNATFTHVKIFLPWEKYIATQEWVRNNVTRWENQSWQIFAQLNDNIDFEQVTDKIKDIPMQHLTAASDGKMEILLHPMDKWHLYSDFENGKITGGQIRFVWLFGCIAVFVLLLACINFMNLSTARSEKRAKEVGIRKAIGSTRSQLIKQFLSESLLMAAIAFVIAIGIVLLSLTYFNNLSDKEIQMPWSNVLFWTMAVSFTIFTGLISGSYPAFYLSSFNPIKVLKGTFRMTRFASLPRKVLVVVQFTISIALIIGTITVFRQIRYGKDRPVGYSREGLINLPINTPELRKNYQVIYDELLKTGAVKSIAESSSPATDVWSNLVGFEWKGKEPGFIPSFATVAVSHDFGKTVGWSLVQGRDFSKSFSTDSGMFILNEAAVKLTGFKNPVGETIRWEDKDRKIIGVVKDMVMESPYAPVKPTVYFLEYDWARILTIRVNPETSTREALAKIEPVFKTHNPGSPFEYKFTDEEYAKKFSDEERIGKQATVFAILAIFISCLGLFGLASFVAEQRTKEIGLRKVLGATVFNVWQLLSKDFMLMVIISFVIAVPLSYYFMYNWLQNYQYRTELSWWIFAAAGIGALVITLLTVSFQSVKAAIANPVKSLRTE